MSKRIRPNEVSGTIGLIANAIVKVFAHQSPEESAKDPDASAEKPLTALANLRKTIRDISDELNGNLHRDQLEVLLLAAKVLAEQDQDNDCYNLAEDSELLLYFCRLILPKSSSIADLRYNKQRFERLFAVLLRRRDAHQIADEAEACQGSARSPMGSDER